MQTLKSFLDQSLLIWKDSTAAARFGLALLMILCVGSIIGVGVWSSQPYYVLLASDLEPDKVGKLVDALAAADIAYDIKGTGMVYVDKREWPRAQIAAGKLGVGNSDSALEDVSPWMDPLNQQHIFRRNQEKQLEDSIARFEQIESADVHLSIPERQAFIRQRNAPSASVVLKIMSGHRLNEEVAVSISSMVANAIDGLSNEMVSITDTMGTKYDTDHSMGRLSKQEEYRVMRERELALRAERILSKFLGFGNATVAVSAEYTFHDGETKTTEYDPDKKVVFDETINSTSTTGGSGEGSDSRGGGVLTKSEDLNSKYEISKTERIEKNSSPSKDRMSVSVLVNTTAIEGEDPVEMKTKVEAIVAQAVGLNNVKDEITVEFFKFVDPLPAEVPAGFTFPWEQVNQVLKNLSLGIAAMVALFVAFKVLRKIQPDPPAASEVVDRTSQVSQLSELVQQNPEVFSRIISSWSNLDLSEDSSESKRSKAA